MGSPISVILAEIVMQKFELQLNYYKHNNWKTWLRFVDDIFAIVKKNVLEDFFKHINSIN
jgi:hypothetical protein